MKSAMLAAEGIFETIQDNEEASCMSYYFYLPMFLIDWAICDQHCLLFQVLNPNLMKKSWKAVGFTLSSRQYVILDLLSITLWACMEVLHTVHLRLSHAGLSLGLSNMEVWSRFKYSQYKFISNLKSVIFFYRIASFFFLQILTASVSSLLKNASLLITQSQMEFSVSTCCPPLLSLALTMRVTSLPTWLSRMTLFLSKLILASMTVLKVASVLQVGLICDNFFGSQEETLPSS